MTMPTGSWGWLFAVGLGAISAACVFGGLRGAAVAASAHNLGLVLTLVFGILAATWWRQAATLGNRAVEGIAAAAVARHCNTLNAAAATATGLGLIASAFASTSWGGTEGWACVAGFFLVLALFGGDLHEAVAVSAQERLRGRSLLSSILIALTLLVYAWDRTAT